MLLELGAQIPEDLDGFGHRGLNDVDLLKRRVSA
jgi:hypothetical protein